MSEQRQFRGKRIEIGNLHQVVNENSWVYGSLIEAVDGTFILETGNYSVLFKEPEYHHQGMGCGLEDRDITDRYEAMEHGWEEAMFGVVESYPDFIEVHPKSVGQSTQIVSEDGDGTVIHERDLVELYNEIFEVKFWGGEFVGDNSDFKHGLLSSHELSSAEIIGNTTDTPELLTQK